MHGRNIFFLGAFVFTGLGVSAWALLRAAPSIAAPLDTGLKLAAVTPSPETEQQREARLIEGAKREGKVVYWDTASNLDSVFTKFRQKYPFLVIEYWKSTDEAIYQKIPAEARAGVHNFDVAGVEINFLAELRKTGLMKKYDWPNAKEWSPEHKGRDGSWIARSLNCVAAAYNTKLVSGVEAPKGWDDLLDPKWKGLMSMGKDDTDLVLMLWAAWGKEKTVNYLKALARNNVALGEGVTARTEMLSAGAYKIDVRLNLDRVLDYQRRGAPIEWVRTDPMLTRPTPIFVAEHAPHPNAALLFADWFTSLEGQQAFHDASGKLLPDPRVKSKLGDAVKGQRLMFFPVELGLDGNEAQRLWREIFLK
jgi:iron(III) transport system substrate-binding protein